MSANPGVYIYIYINVFLYPPVALLTNGLSKYVFFDWAKFNKGKFHNNN